MTAPEVYLKAINHVLQWTVDKSYPDFMPPKDKFLCIGGDLLTCHLPDVSEMQTLKFAPRPRM